MIVRPLFPATCGHLRFLFHHAPAQKLRAPRRSEQLLRGAGGVIAGNPNKIRPFRARHDFCLQAGVMQELPKHIGLQPATKTTTQR
jgi:hypothetical protein